MFCPLLKVGIEISYYCIAAYFSLQFCQCLLYVFRCSAIGCTYIYNCYTFLVNCVWKTLPLPQKLSLSLSFPPPQRGSLISHFTYRPEPSRCFCLISTPQLPSRCFCLISTARLPAAQFLPHHPGIDQTAPADSPEPGAGGRGNVDYPEARSGYPQGS